ncbi:hypothetical protein Tco_0398215 [Tanacetum coccineum]
MRTQAINGIMHNSVWISDPLHIKEVFLNFFTDKFQAHESYKGVARLRGGLNNQGCKFNGTWAKIVGLLTSYIRMVFSRLIIFASKWDVVRVFDRIENVLWHWNWSRSDLGVCNLAYLRDMLLKISLVNTNAIEDSCVWTIANGGVFTIGETRCIIDTKLLPSLVPSNS